MPPSRIRISPARVAIMPTTDQPQAPSNRPRSVSPWNSVAFSAARVALVGAASAAVLTWAVGLAAGDLREVHVDEVVGVRLRLRPVGELLAGVLLDARQQRGAARGREEDLLRNELIVNYLLGIGSRPPWSGSRRR